ncbi:hypothetical protein L7F22_065400 [Adiantum nelumboides]|nr:hypothetical protein [Adiantum nelumboides]
MVIRINQGKKDQLKAGFPALLIRRRTKMKPCELAGSFLYSGAPHYDYNCSNDGYHFGKNLTSKLAKRTCSLWEEGRPCQLIPECFPSSAIIWPPLTAGSSARHFRRFCDREMLEDDNDDDDNVDGNGNNDHFFELRGAAEMGLRAR